MDIELQPTEQSRDISFEGVTTRTLKRRLRFSISLNTLPTTSKAPQLIQRAASQANFEHQSNIVWRFCQTFAPELMQKCLHIDTTVFRTVLEAIHRGKAFYELAELQCVKAKWQRVVKLTMEHFSKNDLQISLRNGKLRKLKKSDLEGPVIPQNAELFNKILELLIKLWYPSCLPVQVDPHTQERKLRKMTNSRLNMRAALNEVYGSVDAGLNDLLSNYNIKT